MGETFEIVYEDATLRQAYARNVHLVAWYDAPTLEQMHAYGRAAQTLSARYRGRSALINAIVEGFPRFTPEVRQAAAEYSRKGAHGVGTAHVILVGGLLGSSVRAFLSTANLIGRPKNPTKVFGDLATASAFVAALLSADGTERWEREPLNSLAERVVQRSASPA